MNNYKGLYPNTFDTVKWFLNNFCGCSVTDSDVGPIIKKIYHSNLL